jgi:phosphoribosylformimino-5-aminoimidazole carboxamide ribotide isomerase
MRVLPAIDLKGGKCVRLLRGEWDAETVYGEDPLAMALHWVELGAECLHVVDLDAAVRGGQENAAMVERLCREVPVPIEVGGGIRSLERAETLLAVGAARVIFGTAALREPEVVREACRRFPDRVAVGIDARSGRVAVHGWRDTSEVAAEVLAREVADWGACRLIFTDIERDGTLSGVNLASTIALARSVNVPVTASGGVGSLDDLRRLFVEGPANLDEVIVGRALYAGRLRLPEAIRAARGED